MLSPSRYIRLRRARAALRRRPLPLSGVQWIDPFASRRRLGLSNPVPGAPGGSGVPPSGGWNRVPLSGVQWIDPFASQGCTGVMVTFPNGTTRCCNDAGPGKMKCGPVLTIDPFGNKPRPLGLTAAGAAAGQCSYIWIDGQRRCCTPTPGGLSCGDTIAIDPFNAPRRPLGLRNPPEWIQAECGTYTGDHGEVECCKIGNVWHCGSANLPPLQRQRFASFEQARQRLRLRRKIRSVMRRISVGA